MLSHESDHILMPQAADPFHVGGRDVVLGSHQHEPRSHCFVESATSL
jgi:hypothetical protein